MVSVPPLVLCVTRLPLSIAGYRNVWLLVAVGDFVVSYGLNACRKADIPLWSWFVWSHDTCERV